MPKRYHEMSEKKRVDVYGVEKTYPGMLRDCCLSCSKLEVKRVRIKKKLK